MPGWQSGVAGWSIGPKGSGAPIESDEPRSGCRVGVFTASFQSLLWGMAKKLPDIWLYPIGASTSTLLPLQPERWLLVDREGLSRVAMGGDVRLRIDQSPIRFGNYILECLKDAEIARECCGACNEPLRMYFRVGSQQLCPACTEKFKLETHAGNARNFRRAILWGALSAIAGGFLHGLILKSTHASIGSIGIGLLVGFAMRIASKESAGPSCRWAAVLLTVLAGALPLWWNRPPLAGIIYLAVGGLAAWWITARNVPTAIHGPFHSKAAG